ncbi:MAG: hypothetical protein IJZ35_05765 [Clostridia bacterium]|nr:hypothetical protein [Clostridia bacterium]
MNEDLKTLFYVFAIILFLTGVFFLIRLPKVLKKESKQYNPLSPIVVILLLTLSVLTILATNQKYEKTVSVAFLLLCVLSVLSFSVYEFILIHICTEKITAELTNTQHIYKTHSYRCYFKFRYEGKEYETQSQQLMPYKYIKNHSEYRAKCEIYIHPEIPQLNIIQRKTTPFCIIELITGIFLIAMAIFVFIILHI